MVSEEELRRAIRDILLVGTSASLSSTAALTLCGRRENGHAAGPTNAISHWIWGEPALRRHRPNLRNTLLGYSVHHLASTFWAALFETWRRCERSPPGLAKVDVACRAALVAATAYVVDFKLMPERLTPGFEHHLSRRSLLFTYAAFAAGLALPHLIGGGRAEIPRLAGK